MSNMVLAEQPVTAGHGTNQHTHSMRPSEEVKGMTL